MNDTPSPSEKNHWIDDEDALLGLLRSATGSGPEAPKIVGYLLTKEIASGAQGSVYQATQEKDGRRVAVKILAKQTFPTSRVALRLRRELELVRRLQHPGVVQVLDSGFTETGHPFLVMELLSGETLSHAMPLGKAGGPFQSVANTLLAFLDICSAVDHAHKRGVLHRDLKPSNILFNANGHLCVADFGIAKDMYEESELHNNQAVFLTRAGDLLGSLAYAAPEQLSLTPNDVDVRSDVYALGVILYQLLTGVLPVNADGHLLEVIQRVKDYRPQRPSKTLREQKAAGTAAPGAPNKLPQDLDAVVLMALERSKQDRYQSVADFADDIQCVLQQQPVRARNEGKFASLFRQVRNHRIASACLLLAVFALSTVTVQAVYRAKERQRMLTLASDAQQLFFSDAMQSLGRLAGGAQGKQRLTQATLLSLDRLLAEFPEDHLSRVRRAQTLALQGQQQREQGDLIAAKISYEESLREFQWLSETATPDPTWLHGLSLALVRIGDLSKEDGDMNRALQLYHEALELDLALVSAHPDTANFLDNLFWSWQRLGSVALHSGNSKLAKQHFDRLPALSKRIMEIAPGRHGAAATTSAVHKANAAYATYQDDFALAVIHLQKAVQSCRLNLAKASEEVERQSQLAWALHGLSSLELMIGNVEASYNHVLEATQLAADLTAAEPQAIDLQHLHTVLCLRLLDIAARRGTYENELVGALEALQRMTRKAIDRPDLLTSYTQSTFPPGSSLRAANQPIAAAEITLTALEGVAMLPNIPAIWQADVLRALEFCAVSLSVARESSEHSASELMQLEQRWDAVQVVVFER